MHHARRPGGPVAAAQNCATHGRLPVRGCRRVFCRLAGWFGKDRAQSLELFLDPLRGLAPFFLIVADPGPLDGDRHPVRAVLLQVLSKYRKRWPDPISESGLTTEIFRKAA